MNPAGADQDQAPAQGRQEGGRKVNIIMWVQKRGDKIRYFMHAMNIYSSLIRSFSITYDADTPENRAEAREILRERARAAGFYETPDRATIKKRAEEKRAERERKAKGRPAEDPTAGANG